MFIGHLPAGYLTARLGGLHGLAFAFFVIGSVAPDLDILWFYFADDRAHHHHTYITHRPAVWASLVLAGAFWRPLLWLGLGGLLHMALDTIVGRIAWLWPLSDHATTFVTVPAVHDFWVTNFLLHWTFVIEILICVVALALLLRRKKS